MRPSPAEIATIVRAALAEDAPWGDITSQNFVPAGSTCTAKLKAREDGVLCGEDVFRTAMVFTDPSLDVAFAVHDGAAFPRGATLATVTGNARALLQAERVALNFAQRLSGISTMTAQFVAAAAGTGARIVDTRKTTPGLRLLERYAVRCGGGYNHRYSLSDAVMVKDNHLAALGTTRPAAIVEALLALRDAVPHTTHIEVEVDRLDQLEAVLAAGIDTVLLDNFSLADLRTAVAQIDGVALAEASGGVTLATVAAIAATGVDLISVGALTHSVRSLDLALDFIA